ncbi:MAG TPA: archaetidylserine decarboxylase [Gammaproteobacteria bacterium]|nr:archaetidylserine decarboxylase [Gammaproteobacteria bacterium]
MSLRDALLVLPQRLLPQRALSALVHRLTRLEGPLAELAIKAFCAAYRVDLATARDAEAGYRSFNQFFTRALREDARPIDASVHAVVSPADGAISQIGDLDRGTLLQAKGRAFAVRALLAGDEALSAAVDGGRYAIVYLSPRDYHRVHAPFELRVHAVSYVPGKLYSVNDRTSQVIEALYARNERLVLDCSSEWGRCALVMVGAMLVSAMELRCLNVPDLVCQSRRVSRVGLSEPAHYARGAELGRFNMGSTVILLLPKGAPAWRPDLANGVPVRMGERLTAPCP